MLDNYPENFINEISKTEFFNNKKRISFTNVGYKIPCLNCSKTYVGRTRRCMDTPFATYVIRDGIPQITRNILPKRVEIITAATQNISKNLKN